VARCVDIYEAEYAIVYPQDDRRAGRLARVSPLYERLRGKGAVYGVRNGWERPYWFAPPEVEPRDVPSFRRTNWFAPVGAEARAVRERAGLLDLSSFSKYEVAGPGAEGLLDRLCANRLPRLGRIVASQMLTARGSVECDVTVTRLAADRFLVVSAAAAELHDLDWLRAHAPGDGSVTVENVTADWGVLVLAGPCARDVLRRLTDADLTSAAFPWLAMRGVTVGRVPVRALRVNFVGELGWELHHPVGDQVRLYDRLMDAGRDAGLVDFGFRAMDSLRLEKGYRAWGADINTEVTPLEAGLARLVALDKGPFIGREALVAQAREGVRKRLCTLDVQADDADAWGNEAVWAGDRVVGITTSGGYAHWLGKSLAVAYVDAERADPGIALDVEILGARRPATVVAEPLFDPENSRLRR
jgi:dimethylglycine dehydrogenase